MSPVEVLALRFVGGEMAETIKPEHRNLLIRMGLARFNSAGTLEITEEGRVRLAAEPA